MAGVHPSYLDSPPDYPTARGQPILCFGREGYLAPGGSYNAKNPAILGHLALLAATRRQTPAYSSRMRMASSIP